MIVQCVEKGAVDQVGRPDHGCRPDQKTSRKTGESVPSAECRDAQQHLPAPAKVLTVESLLSYYNISCVQGTAAIGRLPESVSSSFAP
jgi:hypothetical protein